MQISVATHFSHGGAYSERQAEKLFDLIKDSGAHSIRDGLPWGRIEVQTDHYVFDDWRTQYVDVAIQEGFDPLLTLMPTNALYDDGTTVVSKAGRAGFAAYVDAVLERFPEVNRVAIGNEFNGLNNNFVSGTAATHDYAQRAIYYTEILKSVNDVVGKAHPEVEIVGGALHSIPTGYVEHLAAAGAFAYMDTLDFHPYGMDPVEIGVSLARLNEILDGLDESERPGLVVSEFGRSASSADPMFNSDYLAKMLAIFADAGVSEAVWYALLDEDRSGTPDMGLYQDQSTANAVLDGFRYMTSLFEEYSAPIRMEVGPGVQGYSFGEEALMVWGSSQGITFTGKDLTFRDTAGRKIEMPQQLSDQVIIVEGSDLGIRRHEGGGNVIADSFYDFSLYSEGTGWSYLAEKTKDNIVSEVTLEIMDGQSRGGEIWYPYLGSPWFRPFMLNASVARPVDFAPDGRNERAVLERFIVREDRIVDIVGSWEVGPDTQDGVLVEIRVEGQTLFREEVLGHAATALTGIVLKAGQTIDFVIQDNGSDIGDRTVRHLRVLETQDNTTANDLIATHVQNDIITGNDYLETAESPHIFGTSKPDILSGTSGVDLIWGYDGNDRLNGAGGADILYGGNGKDTLLGGEGNDRLTGGSGRDRLEGGTGDDHLFGGSEGDVLLAGGGEDRLWGGSGCDQLKGGPGADIFVFDDHGADWVRDFNRAEGDRIDLGLLGVDEVDDLRLIDQGAATMLQMSLGEDWINIAVFSANSLSDDLQSLFDDGAFILS